MTSTVISLKKSVWQRLGARLRRFRLPRDLAGETGTDSVAFSIAFIALCAKLAKADGLVTRDEVIMFRQIFEIPASEERAVARVYDLCRQSTTGFEAYARQIDRSLGVDDIEARCDVLDGLALIAMADGEFHPDEEAFLRSVADCLGVPDAHLAGILARHVPDRQDPFLVLQLSPDAEIEDLRQARRALAKLHHPDRMTARGIPAEMRAIAQHRMAAINAAYDEALRLIGQRQASDLQP